MRFVLLGLLLAASDIPESQLITQVGDKDVFPPAFRGTWGPNLAACSGDRLEVFKVSENRIRGYESDSLLLKSTPVIQQSGPKSDDWAYTVVGLTADRGETEVGFGKVRLSRIGSRLYMSNANSVPEEQHFNDEFANVRCP